MTSPQLQRNCSQNLTGGDCNLVKPPPVGVSFEKCQTGASAPGETRTPNRLIRSQMLCPLSYEGEKAI